MKLADTPKTIEEYLKIDRRKYDIILSKYLFTDVCTRIKKLEKNGKKN